jgi:hypothetical protein
MEIIVIPFVLFLVGCICILTDMVVNRGNNNDRPY